LLLFVNAHYAPDVASSGQHLMDLAEYLAGRGWPVEVVAGRGAYAGGRVAAPGIELRHGVRIRRVGSASRAEGRASIGGRVGGYVVFLLCAAWVICTRRGVRGVIVLTTPPMLPVAAWLGRLLRGRRYGIWSMDLHPEAEVAAGVVGRDAVVARILQWLADRTYRNADFVVAMGSYMQRRIVARGTRPGRTHVVPAWAPQGADAGTVTGREALRRSWGLAERYIVMYAGNAGIVHDVTPILGAMQLLRDHPRVFFLFVGGGPRRTEVELFAELAGISNFAYREYVSRAELAELLGSADVHLASLRAPFAGISVPGKVYGAMAAGRPIVYVGPDMSEVADAVRDARCGVVIDPGGGPPRAAAERIAAAIREWCADPVLADTIGARGHAAWRAAYTRDVNCAAWERILRSAWPSVAVA
jgi:colanic acid biosynthesis glycosyl transferase WcaI